MTVPVRTLDDGAWISVNNARAVSNSDIWPLASYDFCDCDVAHVLCEAFYDVSIHRGVVAVGAVGQCIGCGAKDTIDALPVGRVVDGEFYQFEPGSFQAVNEPRS
ncbi:hypothetical protein G9464_12240 [Halostella sp. JP-L12]|uniref:hypothetical protein n=1 Tax=Halostella TaxID=1843185 RepID=UPI000EF78527|nr:MULTISPECIES: hypothetical protein [Halostella]NHN48360.1 hypothetical protein [Halostella sp. JP-L12]